MCFREIYLDILVLDLGGEAEEKSFVCSFFVFYTEDWLGESHSHLTSFICITFKLQPKETEVSIQVMDILFSWKILDFYIKVFSLFFIPIFFFFRFSQFSQKWLQRCWLKNLNEHKVHIIINGVKMIFI